MSSWDYFVGLCEVAFSLFIMYYVVEEILEIRIHRLHYFKSLWNCLDVLIVAVCAKSHILDSFLIVIDWVCHLLSLLRFQLSVVAIIMNITRAAMVGNLLKGLLENHTSHPSFESLANLQVQFNNVAAIIVFFSWVKVQMIFFLVSCRSSPPKLMSVMTDFSHSVSFLNSSILTRPWTSSPPLCLAVPRTLWVLP